MTLVAQITDLHLGGDAGAEGRLDAVLAHLADMATAPAALVVTGDVLDRPDAPGGYAAVGARLAALGVPVVACPGNHDDRASFGRVLGGKRAGGPVDTRLDLDGVTVLACDSTVRGEDWGRLEPSTLDWLARELADTRGPVLVALHHTPCRVGLPLIDEVALRDADELARALAVAQGRVLAVVCGHAHTSATAFFAGVPVVVCPAVSSWLVLDAERPGPFFDRVTPPALALHVVEDGRLTTHMRVVGPVGPGTIEA